MFEFTRDYLESIANAIGVTDVRFEQGSATGVRTIRIFSMPTRGRVEQVTDAQDESAGDGLVDYIDPNDKSPARAIDVSVTDSTGNTLNTIKATGANFITKGVVPDDYFIRDDNNLRRKIAAVPDEDTLTLTAIVPSIADNDVAFHVSSNDGNPIVKKREIKAIKSLTFVVQFSTRKVGIADTDHENFMKKVGKYIFDGQYAQHLDPRDDVTVVEDAVGNPIKINFGNYEFLDNKNYGELQNTVLQEIEFVGGLYTVPDPATADIAVDNDWVVPVTSIT